MHDIYSRSYNFPTLSSWNSLYSQGFSLQKYKYLPTVNSTKQAIFEHQPWLYQSEFETTLLYSAGSFQPTKNRSQTVELRAQPELEMRQISTFSSKEQLNMLTIQSPSLTSLNCHQASNSTGMDCCRTLRRNSPFNLFYFESYSPY